MMSRARFARGEIASLVGLSGSGKSTLALALLRLLHYRGGDVTGSIRLEGRELIGLKESEMRRVRGRAVGYVPQSPNAALNPRLRVRTLLEETWRAHSKERADADFFAVFLRAFISPATRVPGAQSGPTEHRTGTAAADRAGRSCIIPAVLIADEPTSALDVITQAHVLKLFEEFNRSRGAAILLSRTICYRLRRSVIGSTF